MDRAYSLLEIKSIDDERRTFSGIATTPSTDSEGDIVEPLGVQFRNPLPLKFEHKLAIGEVTFDPPTPTGVNFTARIPKITEPGVLKDRTDEAWHSVKYRIVRGASIGFERFSAVVEKLPTGGLHFLKVIAREMSICVIPANQDATILAVKSIDAESLAASGRHSSGATDSLPVVRVQKETPKMANTYQEQITSFENTRAARVAERDAIQQKAMTEGRSKDPAEKEKFDELTLELKSIDSELSDLREMEKSAIANATAITKTTDPVKAAELRGGEKVITVKPNVEKGTAFIRFAAAMAFGKGDSMKTLAQAQRWKDSTPEVELMVKAAVAAGSTTDAVWAGPLAPTQTAINEFLELLRPRTIIGRVPGFRQVPFNTAVPSQTGGGTYSWVGQGNAKPVTSAAFATVTVPFAKAAGIIVLTEELVKLSTPSAEATIRTEMIDGMSQFLDTQLVDPAIAAVANVNPASITNGAATAAASGVSGAAARADLAARVATFTAANIPLDGAVWLMSDSSAFGIGLSLNALGQPLFPGVGREGGTIMGIPVIVSNNVGARIVLVHAPSILYADEGGVQIDVSREASIQMDSAPTNPSDATTVLVSLWQRNLVGLRAERMITWIRARTAAVTYLTGVAYNGS